MKTLKVYFIIFTMLIAGNVVSQEYNINMKTIFSGENESTRLQHIKSAVDSQNYLYIVFLNEGKAYFGTNSSGDWQFTHLTYFDNEYNEEVMYSSYPNIAIDKNDNIHIVMFGRYSENIYWSTKPASASSGKWEFKDARQFTDLKKLSLHDEYTDMCVDKNGGLHAYCCASVGNESYYENWMSAVYFYKPANSDVWDLDWIMPGISDEYSYAADPAIASAGDKVYITIGGDRSLHFGTKNISGGQWEIEKFEKFAQTPNDMNSWKHMTTLCTTPNGNPKFAFYDYYNGNQIGLNWFYGMNVFSKSSCGNNEWLVDHSIDEPERKFSPAMAVDSKGKTYIAFGGSDFYLYTQNCDCNQGWEQLYNNVDQKTDFVDMVIDHHDAVNVFYTSVYDNKLYHLTAIPQGSTEECNFRPSLSFKGKTNVKPGEEWTGKIYAHDPECDPVEIYSIILDDNAELIDHGDGSATLKISTPYPEEGEEPYGEAGGAIFCRDNKHSGPEGNNSAMSVVLRISPEGNEEGRVKIDNRCTGSSGIPLSSIDNIFVDDRSKPFQTGSGNGSGVTTNTQDNNTQKVTAPEPEQGDGASNNEGVDNEFDEAQSASCTEYLDRYEAWANKYIPLKKRVNENPMDVEAAMKLAELAMQLGNWGLEWSEKHYCSENEGFVKRYEDISARIDAVN